MEADLRFVALMVKEWPADPPVDRVRLDRDGEICFEASNPENGDEYPIHDFFPAVNQMLGEGKPHPCFVESTNDRVLGKTYTHEQWQQAREELLKED